MKKIFNPLRAFSLISPLLINVIFASCISAQGTARVAPSAEWLGTYFYEQVFDRNPNSGYVDTIMHTLIISRKGDGLAARYTADGVQTWDDYECTVKPVGDHLMLYYSRDLRPADNPGRDRGYKPGSLLGTLSKSVSRGRVVYLFRAKYFFSNKYPGVLNKRK